jgi:hypothetical protein
VAARVVDRLEVVDVGQDERERLAEPLRALVFAPEHVEELAPVRDAG